MSGGVYSGYGDFCSEWKTQLFHTRYDYDLNCSEANEESLQRHSNNDGKKSAYKFTDMEEKVKARLRESRLLAPSGRRG